MTHADIGKPSAAEDVFDELKAGIDSACQADNADLSFPKYRFDVPAGIQDPLAQSMYWDLMNRMRGGLCMPEFTIHDSFRAK